MSGFFGPSSGGSGSFPNRSFSTTLSNASGTTVIPTDNTIPQSNEGTEVVSATITPSTSAVRIRVHAQIIVSYSIASQWIVGALFTTLGGANAVAASQIITPSSPANAGGEINLFYEYVPGSTSVQTVAARCGPGGGGGTVTFNTLSNSVTLGGVIKSSITLTEVAAA